MPMYNEPAMMRYGHEEIQCSKWIGIVKVYYIGVEAAYSFDDLDPIAKRYRLACHSKS